MAIESLTQLNDMHLDVLTEIGNIGSGNAATALATLLNTLVDIEIPHILLVDYQEVSELLGGEDKLALGMSVGLEGDLQGLMLQIVQKEFANKLINNFYEKKIDVLEDVSEMDLSVMQEMSNITTAAYVNSIASMTNTFINISPPTVCVKPIGEILQTASEHLHSPGHQVLYIDENLVIGGTQIKSSMIMILELESLTILFEKLGITI